MTEFPGTWYWQLRQKYKVANEQLTINADKLSYMSNCSYEKSLETLKRCSEKLSYHILSDEVCEEALRRLKDGT